MVGSLQLMLVPCKPELPGKREWAVEQLCWLHLVLRQMLPPGIVSRQADPCIAAAVMRRLLVGWSALVKQSRGRVVLEGRAFVL